MLGQRKRGTRSGVHTPAHMQGLDVVYKVTVDVGEALIISGHAVYGETCTNAYGRSLRMYCAHQANEVYAIDACHSAVKAHFQ